MSDRKLKSSVCLIGRSRVNSMCLIGSLRDYVFDRMLNS